MTHHCILCGSERSSLLFRGHDWLHHSQVVADLLQCAGCGLIWLWPQPASALEAYPPTYAPHQGIDATTGVARGYGQRRGLARKVRLAQLYGRGPFLDIGCAAGDFLETMRDQGAGPLLGMDIHEEAVQLARERSGALVWVGSELALPLGEGSIGTVTLWHVLEHLPQPLEALCEITRVLGGDGILLLACPMADSWEARLFGQHWAGYDVPRHLFAFSRKTLPCLLEQAGLAPTEVHGVVYGYNSARLSAAFWLRQFSFFRDRPRWLDVAADMLGACSALACELLSRLFGNHRAVAAGAARSTNRRPPSGGKRSAAAIYWSEPAAIWKT